MVRIVVCVIAKEKPKNLLKVKEFDVSYVINADWNRPRARNHAVDVLSDDYDWIVFVDSDCSVDGGWERELLDSIENCGADVISGLTLGNPPRVPMFVDGVDITWPTCNIAYRSSALVDVGGFDNDMVTAEDCELNYRLVKAGYDFFYNPRMIVFHTPHQKWWVQSFWNGYGRYLLKKKHPDVKVVSLQPLRMGFGLLGYLYGKICKKSVGK